jgi:competence protein ComFC
MWKYLADLFFPKKCINCRRFENYLCVNCFSKINYNDSSQCPHCFRPSLDGLTHPNCKKQYGLDGAISVVIYGNVIKKLIYQYKYKPNLKGLSNVIGKLMVEGLSQNEGFYLFLEKNTPTIIPIPLSKKKQRERGYNHAVLIGAYVAQYCKLSLKLDILVRLRDTKPQYKLNKDQRIKNIKGAFGIKPGTKIPSSIILVDDIATTYSTLREATKILKRNGARKVFGVTFAKET